jgi:predicted RNA-binding protein YlxR (DUF448 family)
LASKVDMTTRVRSCVSCRKKGMKGELIKLANTPAGVIIDYAENLPGRGAYVCADKACIERLSDGALSRVFKAPAKHPETSAFYEELGAKVMRKVKSLLGMAMKSRLAATGFDESAGGCVKYPGGVLVVAQDVSDNTGRRIMEHCTDKENVFRFSTKDELGRVLGSRPVGVVYVRPSALSLALGRELGRLVNMSRG